MTRLFECACFVAGRLMVGEVELPGSGLGTDTTHANAGRMPHAFIGLAAVALAVVIFLVGDFVRQKRVEKRERDRLQRFREKKLNHSQT